MAAKTTPTGASAPVRENVLECHAVIRSDGGFRRFRFRIPESIASQYVEHVSDVYDFGNIMDQVDHDLFQEKERG